MRRVLTFETAAVLPDPAAALRRSGMVTEAVLPERFSALLDRAARLFEGEAEPRGILEEVSTGEFEVVYRGEGRNEARTPVGEINARAERLALFAVSLGERMSREITGLFEAREFALGAILDALASEAADAAAELAGRSWLETLSATVPRSEPHAGVHLGPEPGAHIGAEHGAQGAPQAREQSVEGTIAKTGTTIVLAYSPGYCGWHISGQRKLFERLRPEEIGITLNPSFLMQPLKSVSGVLIAGDRGVHEFPDSFPFCDECIDRQCRARIASLGSSGLREDLE